MAFKADSFMRKLNALENTQESIQTLSLWILHHRAQHKEITANWLTAVKSAKPEHCLHLFYLANDVIQSSQRKKTTVLVTAFEELLEEACAYARDNEIKPKLKRIFSIWETRSIFPKHFCEKLTTIVDDTSAQSKATAKLLAEFRPEVVFDKILYHKRLCDEVALKRRLVDQFSAMDVTSTESLKKLKEKTEGHRFQQQFEDGAKRLQDIVWSLEKKLKEQVQLIESLEQTKIFFDAQQREARIVVNAYKNYGSRILTMKKRVDEKKKNLKAALQKANTSGDIVGATDMEIDDDVQKDSVLTLNSISSSVLSNVLSTVGSSGTTSNAAQPVFDKTPSSAENKVDELNLSAEKIASMTNLLNMFNVPSKSDVETTTTNSAATSSSMEGYTPTKPGIENPFLFSQKSSDSDTLSPANIISNLIKAVAPIDDKPPLPPQSPPPLPSSLPPDQFQLQPMGQPQLPPEIYPPQTFGYQYDQQRPAPPITTISSFNTSQTFATNKPGARYSPLNSQAVSANVDMYYASNQASLDQENIHINEGVNALMNSQQYDQQSQFQQSDHKMNVYANNSNAFGSFSDQRNSSVRPRMPPYRPPNAGMPPYGVSQIPPRFVPTRLPSAPSKRPLLESPLEFQRPRLEQPRPNYDSYRGRALNHRAPAGRFMQNNFPQRPSGDYCSSNYQSERLSPPEEYDDIPTREIDTESPENPEASSDYFSNQQMQYSESSSTTNENISPSNINKVSKPNNNSLSSLLTTPSTFTTGLGTKSKSSVILKSGSSSKFTYKGVEFDINSPEYAKWWHFHFGKGKNRGRGAANQASTS